MGRETFELSLKIVHQKNKRNCVGHLYMSSRPNGMSSVVLKIAANHGEAQYILAKIYEMRGSDGVEVLRINSSFASLLELAENSTVRCAIVDRSMVPDCRRAKAEISWDHWTIVGRNRRLIEHQLLQQIQLVRKGMKFPLHIRRNQVEITIVDVSLDQKNDEAIAFLVHSTELEIDAIPDAHTASPDVHSSYVCAPFSSRKETSHQPMKGFLNWGQNLIASMTNQLLYNRSTSVDDTEGYLRDIQESRPSKRTLASQAAATARERQGFVSGSSYPPEKLPHPIDRSGKLLRVQKRPTGLLETLEEMANTPEERCLIRQPTTIFVSDWSFPNFSHNQRVGELLFSITVATETAKETTSTPTINDADEGTNGSDAVNGGGNGRKISTGSKKSNDSGGGGGGTGAIVGRLYICRNDELDESQQIQSGHVVVHDMIRRQLRARLCSLILVKPLDGLGSKVQGITLQSVLNKVGGVYEKDKRESFWWWLKDISCDAYPLPAVNGQLASISIKFQPMVGKIDFLINIVEGSALTSTQVETKPKYFLLKPTMEGHLHVAAQVDALSPTNPDVETLRRLPPTTVQSLDPKLPPVQLSDLGGIEDLAQEGLSHLCSCLTDEIVFSLGNGCAGLAGGGLLIAGTTRDGAGSLGIGKTSLAYALCREMTEQPVLAHIVTLECALLRGKGVGGVQKRLKAIFDDAASHQPSIVFLDNLDHLISAPTSGMAETAGDALYSTKLAQTLCDLVINELHRGSVIALIATSRSRDSLHPTLMPRRGQHVFKKVLELKAPNKARRKDILKAIARRKKCHILNDNRTLELVAQRTYGYGAQDLLKLIERTEHRSLASDLHRRSKTMMPPGGLAEPLTPSLDGQPITARLFGVRKPLTFEEFSEEIELCRPSSLRNVPLHSPGEKSWRDVGGLENIKTMLIETFEWPAKYPELFSKCPLRLRSGLLLYGAPGTGKTLIAGVVAKECGLNFISIKGPELLNKYIGASEEAVRSMFERAQAAQPCILFFDEFDSIAPKRGHDNTGVTDRVVNQFLTQLDGVEGLQGVYVLAATSRPDLIDPALLRPGRLDKSLFLPMPDEGGRTAILKALANDVALDSDVNVDQIASKTAFFSGADLKALLYNAQLESIRQSKDYALSVDRAPPTPRYQKGVKLGTFERKTPKKVLQKLEERDESFVEGDSVSDFRSMYSLPSDVDSDGPKMDKRLSDVEKTRPKHLSLNRRSSSEGSIDVLPVSGYFMSSIADGVCEMSHEVEKQIKSKYSEYLKRQVGPEGRKMSFAMKAPPKFQHQSSQAGVRMEHIQTALLNMGPSLSEQDRAKYQAIYDRFGNRGKGETAPEHFQQKITHA